MGLKQHKAELRQISCFLFTLEDVYIVLCLAVSLCGLIMCLLEGLNVFDNSFWERIYLSAFLGVGTVVCFLQAVPSFRVRPVSPHLLGAAAILLFGNALGFGLSYVWSQGLTLSVEAFKKFQFAGVVETLKVPDVPEYSDAIAFNGALGIGLGILSALHEFTLKRDKYPRRQPCRYLMFLSVVGVACIWNTALGVLTVNPDLEPLTTVFGTEVEMATEHQQPLIVMASLRYGAAAAVALLLIRNRCMIVVSKLLVALVALGHGAMTAFSFINLKVGGEWELFPNVCVGVMFSSTTALLVATLCAAQCCAPKPESPKRLPSVASSRRNSRANSTGSLAVDSSPMIHRGSSADAFEV